jgi:hypothetical protein
MEDRRLASWGSVFLCLRLRPSGAQKHQNGEKSPRLAAGLHSPKPRSTNPLERVKREMSAAAPTSSAFPPNHKG